MREVVARVLLAGLTVSAAVVGAWAAFTPASFYADFPGAGRHWVSVDGPYNEHLVGDVGTLNLALAIVTAVALVTLGRHAVRTAVAAWLVYGVPHLVYHLRHLEPLAHADRVANITSLTLAVVAPLVVLVLTLQTSARRTPT